MSEATGLMAFWADIADDYVAEFREWHNCEHIPERVSVPGFTMGRRYCGIDGAPMFLMSYETADTGVLQSKPYLERLNAPTPWTRKSVAQFKNGVRTIYTLLGSAGTPSPTEAAYVLTARFDLDPADEDAWLAWARDRYLPALAAVDGVHRARLYAVDEAGSNVETSERGLHGAVPSGQRYCAWIEFATRDVPDDPAFAAAGKAGPDGGGVERQKNLLNEVFWLDFVLASPNGG
jgi:hypothetical protein